MPNQSTYRVTPPKELGEALNAKALAALPSSAGRTGKRRRKYTFEAISPLTRAPYEVSWTEKNTGEWNQDCVYSITCRPADHLASTKCLTENMLLRTIRPVVDLFTDAMGQKFPELTDALQSLGVEHCSLSHVAADYPFLMESEQQAVGVFSDLFTHCKAVMDGVEHSCSTRKKTLAADFPRVHTHGQERWAFTVDFPFGTATIKLIRSWDDCPKSLNQIKDAEARKEVRALLRCVLLVSIKVDLERFSFGGKTLPTNPQLWTHKNLEQDPFKLIWNAFHFETWLNWPLISDESQIDWEVLNEEERALLRAYLEPVTADIRQLPFMKQENALGKFHTALINKAFANIEIPWSILRKNQSRELGLMLGYDKRLKPECHPQLRDHTMTREGLEQAHMALTEAMTKSAHG